MRALVLRLLLGLAAWLTDATTTRADDIAEADAALADTFTLQGVTATQPRLPDGGYDWDWRGPRNDPEWSWFFNRHEAFLAAQRAWRATGDRRYLDWIFATLDDWIVTHPAPGRMTFSAAWRPLEAARRILGPWTVVYENLHDDPAFTAERRDRFLDSVRAHGEQLRHHHALFGNHLITEMLALAQLCLVFPETDNTEEWLAYSLGRLAREYDAQVYPDGAYKELSTHYQRVVAVNYQQLLDLLVKTGRVDEARDWRARAERLWSYLHTVQKPDGTAPLNNDSDLEDVAALLRAYAPRLADEPPHETVALPHAGQIVFRDGGATPASPQWAFFDRGPHGTAHQHEDRLHFALAIGTTNFLVDNGRYTYVPGPWRDYFAGPAGHNVVLLDGRGGETGPEAIDAAEPPATTLALGERWESAFGDSRFALDGNPRAADWRRIVVNLRGDGWLVVDRVVAFGPRTVETLWHWHPDCEVTPDGDARLLVQNGGRSLRVALATTARTDLGQVRGSEAPVQGWHSPRFNQRMAATCTTARQTTGGPLLNVWFFSPGPQPAGVAIRQRSGHRVRLLLTRGDDANELTLDLNNPANLRWPVTPENAR
ncbi:MAG: alginate lyase family protein [Verrucomicrobiota bacterium]